MMEDIWLAIDEDDSSNPSFADSDIIDSETEAELYSVIHYEQNLHDFKPLTTESKNVETSEEMKNELFQEKNKESVMTQSACSRSSDSPNSDNDNDGSSKTLENLIHNKVSQKLNPDKKTSCNNDKSSVSLSKKSNIDINHVKENDNKKRKTNHGSSRSSNLMNNNCSDVNDSSDSDSIMFLEVDTSDIQTNLQESVICLSSESESESQFNSFPLSQKTVNSFIWFNRKDVPVSKKNEENLNLSMPNIKIGESTKDSCLWFMNDQDLRASRRSRLRRYHDNAEDTCSNCLRKGHNARICVAPKKIKCYICGENGHLGSQCIKRICGKCFNTGHSTMQCRTLYASHCTICDMRGHIKVNCPDIWRRYHLTTSPGKIVHGENTNSNEFCYCWTCGEGGHSGADCNVYRGPKCLPFWPCVVSYDEPEDLLKDRLKFLGGKHGNSKRPHLNQANYAVGGNNQVNCAVGGNNQVNCAVGGNVTVPKAVKRNKKKKKKINLNNLNTLEDKLMQRLNNIKREKDFPRTFSNKKNQCGISDNDAIPEVLKKALMKKNKGIIKRQKRRIKKQMKFLARAKELMAGGNGLQMNT